MGYEIEIDKEINSCGINYSVFIEANITYSCSEDPEPTEVEIVKAEVAPLEGDPLPISYEGRAIEKVIVEGHPELTEAIDKALWDEIQTHTEDYFRDIQRDLEDARDDYYL